MPHDVSKKKNFHSFRQNFLIIFAVPIPELFNQVATTGLRPSVALGLATLGKNTAPKQLPLFYDALIEKGFELMSECKIMEIFSLTIHANALNICLRFLLKTNLVLLMWKRMYKW